MSANVLVDTSIWIYYLRKNQDYFQTIDILLDKVLCFVTEPIVSELLQGVKTEGEFEKLRSYIDALPLEAVVYDDWINAGRLCFNMRKKGITIPLTDALIASVAIRADMEIFTLDRHFEVIPGIILYKTA